MHLADLGQEPREAVDRESVRCAGKERCLVVDGTGLADLLEQGDAVDMESERLCEGEVQ